MSRKMLLRSCETDVALLNKEIRDSSNPKQALHRGFSKFMFEDLVRHPIFQNLSAKKKRGLSANIGFEMIRVSKSTIKNMVSLCQLTFLLLFPVWIEKRGIFKFG